MCNISGEPRERSGDVRSFRVVRKFIHIFGPTRRAALLLGPYDFEGITAVMDLALLIVTNVSERVSE